MTIFDLSHFSRKQIEQGDWNELEYCLHMPRSPSGYIPKPIDISKIKISYRGQRYEILIFEISVCLGMYPLGGIRVWKL